MAELGNVMIFGDSYSTFKGYIPNEHKAYYGNVDRQETDVDRVEHTWWHQLLNETNSNLILNHSWSGTTICNTGYEGPDAPHSFVRRFDELVDEGFFRKKPIDTILVMGGQNDDWCNAPIGELKTQDWTYADLLQYGPALCYLMCRIKTILPNSRSIFIINSEMSNVIMDYQEKAAEIYNMEYVRLERIHKMNGHPTIQGMRQIRKQIMAYLEGDTNL